jgi:prefoldin alpha subunit
MEEEKELQEKILAHRLIEARIEGLLKQRENLMRGLMEIEETIDGINELEKKGEDVLFSLGSQTYIPSKIVEKDKIIVEIGANIALEKNLKDGKQILEKRMEKIESSLASIESAINQLSSGLKDLGEEIREMVNKRKAG